MITLEGNELVFRFPEIHEDAILRINFQRTLRIPDDNRSYSLPPGLGKFPLSHIDDHSGRVPPSWNEHGGVFLPMYQAEALWVNFDAIMGYPFAVKIAAGKINAVTGKEWNRELHRGPQDYMSIPTQPWLDGFCVSDDHIRQFVAMPLGQGYTAEEQLTGKAEHGGLQIIVYPMKLDRYLKLVKRWERSYSQDIMCCRLMGSSSADLEMGLAPGGLMKQKIFKDEHGLKAWHTSMGSRCFVHMVNSLQYREITGFRPPSKPPTAKHYTEAGLPWFDYYDADAKALEGSKDLAGLHSVAAKAIIEGEHPLPENDPVSPSNVKVITAKEKEDVVREGKF